MVRAISVPAAVRLIALALVLGAVLLPLSGLRALTVLSGSMEPGIGIGDLLLARPVAPEAVRVGDVVTFVDPGRGGKLLTHRLVAVEEGAGRYVMTTRGDANGASETWSVARDGRVGRVVARVPRVGWALVWLDGAAGRVIGVVLPSLIVGGLLMRRIWRRPPPP